MPLGSNVPRRPESTYFPPWGGGVRDKMAFVMGAPSPFPRHLAAPARVAHGPQAVLWGRRHPNTKTRQYYKKTELQTSVFQQHRKVCSVTFCQTEGTNKDDPTW